MTAEDSQEADLRVVALLGCAALLAAVVGAASAILGDRGSDRYHQALRDDVRQGSRIVSDIRALYGEDAPVAHRAAEYALRAEALDAEARGSSGPAAEVLRAEAAALRGTASVLVESSDLAGTPEEALELTGADLGERLGEIRSKLPADLAALDPDAVEAEGSHDVEKATLLVATTLASGIAFLFGALAEAIPRLRRRLTTAGFGVVGVGAVVALMVALL